MYCKIGGGQLEQRSVKAKHFFDSLLIVLSARMTASSRTVIPPSLEHINRVTLLSEETRGKLICECKRGKRTEQQCRKMRIQR